MENPMLSAELSALVSQLVIARNEINNLRQQLNALRHTHRKEVDQIKELLNSYCSGGSSGNEVLSPVSEQPASSSTQQSRESVEFPYRMIGSIDTGLSSKRSVPRQTCILSQSQGILRIDTKLFTNAHHALEGLEQYSHMWILFHFHKVESNHCHSKVAPPRLNGIKTGVFATRSPNRPTPIGLSLVKIDKVEGNCIFFSGVDMLDGTPVLDIKPYIPDYDTPYPAQANAMSEHRWQRLPLDADTRSEDEDLDLQERLLIGESHASETHPPPDLDHDNPLEDIRVLDGRDSDDAFPSTPQPTPFTDNASRFDRFPVNAGQQREAPEGSEGGSPLHHSVRVPPWVNNPPLHTLTVHFADDCLQRIAQLTGSQEAADRLQTSISSVLREDPRSVYVRERYSEDPYVCNMLGYQINCLFDDTSHACLVTSVEASDATPRTNTDQGV